jgi:hypothetical protein
LNRTVGCRGESSDRHGNEPDSSVTLRVKKSDGCEKRILNSLILLDGFAPTAVTSQPEI